MRRRSLGRRGSETVPLRVFHKSDEFCGTAVAPRFLVDFLLRVGAHPTPHSASLHSHSPAEAREGVLTGDGKKGQDVEEVHEVRLRQLGQAVHHDLDEDGVEERGGEEEGEQGQVVVRRVHRHVQQSLPVVVVGRSTRERRTRQRLLERVELDVLDGDGEIRQVVLDRVVENVLDGDLRATSHPPSRDALHCHGEHGDAADLTQQLRIRVALVLLLVVEVEQAVEEERVSRRQRLEDRRTECFCE